MPPPPITCDDAAEVEPNIREGLERVRKWIKGTGISDSGASTVMANNTVYAGSGTNAAVGNVGIHEANTQTAVAIL